MNYVYMKDMEKKHEILYTYLFSLVSKGKLCSHSDKARNIADLSPVV